MKVVKVVVEWAATQVQGHKTAAGPSLIPQTCQGAAEREARAAARGSLCAYSYVESRSTLR